MIDFVWPDIGNKADPPDADIGEECDFVWVGFEDALESVGVWSGYAPGSVRVLLGRGLGSLVVGLEEELDCVGVRMGDLLACSVKCFGDGSEELGESLNSAVVGFGSELDAVLEGLGDKTNSSWPGLGEE